MELKNENGTGAPLTIADADYAAVYRWALGFAHKRAGGNDETEQVLIDATADAILWARDNCRDATTFVPFAKTTIRRWCGRALHRLKLRRSNRPHVGTLTHEVARARVEKPVRPLLIEDLPEDLAFAVRLYFTDGYTLRECGHLMGLSPNTIETMLHRAAELFAPGRIKPQRGNGEKCLSAR